MFLFKRTSLCHPGQIGGPVNKVVLSLSNGKAAIADQVDCRVLYMQVCIDVDTWDQCCSVLEKSQGCWISFQMGYWIINLPGNVSTSGRVGTSVWRA